MYIFKVFAKSLNNVVHNFWENCFRKPKLLLAANRLIYLNISMSKMHGTLTGHSFLHRIASNHSYHWGNQLMIFIS